MLITRSDVAHLISTTYWSAFAIALLILLVITFKISRTAKGRIIGSVISLLIVIGIFIVPFIPGAIKKKKAIKARQDRYQTAKALFDKKCKTAGEKIYRTVDNVEGVTLLKMPKPYNNAYAYDPMWEDAAILRRGGWYIYSLLGTTFPDYSHSSFLIKPKTKKLSKSGNFSKNPLFGYEYVDVKEKNGYRRYTLPWDTSKIVGKALQGQPARYTITYETPVDPNERQYWIAGATIKVIDTKDNSLLAEKTMYLFDHGLGGARGTSGRQPWTHAKNCPKNKVIRNQLRFFIETVLKPKQPNFN